MNGQGMMPPELTPDLLAQLRQQSGEGAEPDLGEVPPDVLAQLMATLGKG